MRGKMDSFTLILIVICSLSLICSIVSMILGIVILKKQSEAVQGRRMNDMNQAFYMEQSNAMVQKNVVPQRAAKATAQGIIICRKCYSAIPEQVKVCPCCQASVDRR